MARPSSNTITMCSSRAMERCRSLRCILPLRAGENVIPGREFVDRAVHWRATDGSGFSGVVPADEAFYLVVHAAGRVVSSFALAVRCAGGSEDSECAGKGAGPAAGSGNAVDWLFCSRRYGVPGVFRRATESGLWRLSYALDVVPADSPSHMENDGTRGRKHIDVL